MSDTILAFLRAIHANPEDSAPILVFADYLQEVMYEPDVGFRYDNFPRWLRRNILAHNKGLGDDGDFDNPNFARSARAKIAIPSREGMPPLTDILEAFGVTTAFGFKGVLASEVTMSESEAIRWWGYIAKIGGGIPVLCRTTKHKQHPGNPVWIRMMILSTFPELAQ